MTTMVVRSCTRVVKTNTTSEMQRGGDPKEQQPGLRPGLRADPEVPDGDEREDEQGDRAADRGDRVEIEPGSEDDRRRGRHHQSERCPAREPLTEQGWELARPRPCSRTDRWRGTDRRWWPRRWRTVR